MEIEDKSNHEER